MSRTGACYVTWGEWGPGAFRTQVVDLVQLLREEAEVTLAALLSAQSRRRLHPDSGAVFLDGPLAGRWPLGLFHLSSRGLTRLVRSTSPPVLHARGPLAAIAARRAGRSIPLIHDYRGLDALEIEAESGASRFTRRLARLEREACLEADVVSVVTEPMQRIVLEDYGVDPERVHVNRCAADVSSFAHDADARAAARARLGVEGPVVAYVGSAADWQEPELCVQTASRLVREDDATFLVLSQHAERFVELCDRHGIPESRRVIAAVPGDELKTLLCVADVGLLPRRPSPGNVVASPIKYAEYLSAGVPVVSVEGAGAFTSEIAELRLGALASGPDPDALADAARRVLHGDDDVRARCRAAASAYDLREVAASYLALYESLARP